MEALLGKLRQKEMSQVRKRRKVLWDKSHGVIDYDRWRQLLFDKTGTERNKNSVEKQQKKPRKNRKRKDNKQPKEDTADTDMLKINEQLNNNSVGR